VTVDEFISRHFKDLDDICRAYLGRTSLKDDLLQEAVIILLEKREDEKLLIAIDKGEGLRYFVGVVRMMVTRKNHKFYAAFISRKPIDREEYLFIQNDTKPEQSKKLNEVDAIISDLRIYKQEIFRLYFDVGFSFSKLATETGISRKTLYNDLTKLKREIKTKIDGHNCQ